MSDTQIFFRENLDSLVQELDTFDEKTTAVLDTNRERSKQSETERINAAIAKAESKHADDA